MAIGQVVTGGLGNGTLVTTIPLVLQRGLKSSVITLAPGLEASQEDTRLHSEQLGSQFHTQQRNTRLHSQDHGGEW